TTRRTRVELQPPIIDCGGRLVVETDAKILAGIGRLPVDEIRSSTTTCGDTVGAGGINEGTRAEGLVDGTNSQSAGAVRRSGRPEEIQRRGTCLIKIDIPSSYRTTGCSTGARDDIEINTVNIGRDGYGGGAANNGRQSSRRCQCGGS